MPAGGRFVSASTYALSVPFLYHVMPAEMRGETLYPLNELRARHPDRHERERRKYIGREALMEVRIPLLGVLWSDALQLSPIHPSHLAAAWRSAGLWSEIWDGEFFTIPLERIAGHRCVWFARGAFRADNSPHENLGFLPPEDEFTWFRPSAYRELVEPPSRYFEYLHRCSRQGQRARHFAYIPHVLVDGSIDVTGVSLVRAKGEQSALE